MARSNLAFDSDPVTLDKERIRGRVLTLDISTLHEDLTLGLRSVESSPPSESPTSVRLSTYGLKAALQTQRVGT